MYLSVCINLTSLKPNVISYTLYLSSLSCVTSQFRAFVVKILGCIVYQGTKLLLLALMGAAGCAFSILNAMIMIATSATSQPQSHRRNYLLPMRIISISHFQTWLKEIWPQGFNSKSTWIIPSKSKLLYRIFPSAVSSWLYLSHKAKRCSIGNQIQKPSRSKCWEWHRNRSAANSILLEFIVQWFGRVAQILLLDSSNNDDRLCCGYLK